MDSERHAGHRPSSLLHISYPHFKEPVKQELHSCAQACGPLPQRSIPAPLPRAPLQSTPLFQAPTSSPAPARRGARVRQGRGPPHRSREGTRASLGVGAPTPGQGRHLGPRSAAARRPRPLGGGSRSGGAGGRGSTPAPGPGPLPSARRMVGSIERVPGGARCPSLSGSRRRGLGNRCSSSSSFPSSSFSSSSSRRLATAAARAGGAAVIPAPEEPALPVPGGRGAEKPGRGGPNR